jgi:hypothetical protein
MRKILLFLGVLAVGAAVSHAQTETKPEILVLGTYHMANPGRDVYNMQADDVLAAKRQQEISEAIEVLKRFRPTKVAIEADPANPRVGKDYADYLAGKYTLSRNEIDQIGYRLAKELGHRRIYPVDVNGDFPLPRVANFAKAHGRAGQYDAMLAKIGAHVKAQDDYLHSHTVLEMLDYMNSDAMQANAMEFYFEAVRYGEDGDYAGPDLVASWYQRNIRIYHNIVQLIDSPNDRILVIYGAGHLGWLQQDAANDASVRIRKLSEFTGQN